ncbi:MAG: hypothetical protein WCH65_09005 [bacterium]
MNMKVVNIAARTLGSPLDLQAGLYLHKKLGDTVKKGEVLYTMYANDHNKINLTEELLNEQKMYLIN